MVWKKETLKRTKYLLHENDPRCYWCGIETEISSIKNLGHHFDREATIDHVITNNTHNKFTLKKVNENFHVGKYVLSCFRCNNIRGNIPFIEFRNLLLYKEFCIKYGIPINNPHFIQREMRLFKKGEIK